MNFEKKPNFPPFFDIKWLQMILRHENDQYQCLWWQLAAYIAKKYSGSFGCVVTSKHKGIVGFENNWPLHCLDVTTQPKEPESFLAIYAANCHHRHSYW